MFGIGFEEFFVIAVILLLAVGPDKMPTFLKAIGKGVREFRRATRELKNSVGLDELMRDEDLRALRRPLAAPSRPVNRAYQITEEDREREYPAEGADITWAERKKPDSPDVQSSTADESEEPEV